MTYTIKRLEPKDIDENNSKDRILLFIACAAVEVNDLYGNNYCWGGFSVRKFLEAKQYLAMCFRDNEPVGFLAATMEENFFDPNVKILKQRLLFALPGTRATNLLVKDFVDFGKQHANHVITMIGQQTNIKPRSLEKLGFKKLEVLYRMETK